MTPDALHAALQGGLVVSCQPVDGGPLDDDAWVARMALAAVAGGAVALRIEGAARLAAVRAALSKTVQGPLPVPLPVPLIGIVKRDLPDSPVRITPWLQDVRDLVAAGANVVAVDATQRPRPVPLTALLAEIHSLGALAMADASCTTDALVAWRAGFDVVGTTLAGYTAGPEVAVPDLPDLALVRTLAQAGCRVMAEGRYDTPERAAAALRAGAWAVTVGSAITRLEVVTGWFAHALDEARLATTGAIAGNVAQTPHALGKTTKLA
jgi:N-acylglucosamine-6-phosphate 2-epimerase